MYPITQIAYAMHANTHAQTPALCQALHMARSHQATLTLIKVLPELPALLRAQLSEEQQQQLADAAIRRERDGLADFAASLGNDLTVEIDIRVGKTFVELIRSVLHRGFSLLVKETDEITWFSSYFGSDDMHLLRKCPCPLLLIGKEAQPAFSRLMAAVDFDEENLLDADSHHDELNRHILSLCASLSLSNASQLQVVNANEAEQSGFMSLWVDHPDAMEKDLYATALKHKERQMAALMDEFKQEVGEAAFSYLAPSTHIIKGRPSQVLPEHALTMQADIVVMGTVARTGIVGVLIGNTAETILSQLRCSVLALKPSAFVCPIRP